MRLKDKVAVVTGGGAGIGRATCLLFAREGAHVVAADRVERDAEATCATIRAAGGPNAVALRVEVANEPDIQAMAETCRQEFGRVDILVNNAGARVYGPVTEASAEDWDVILNVNLRAPGVCCKYIIPLMRPGASIVNVSSSNGIVGRPNMALYDASKAGLLALTRSLACDHVEGGIRVNAILPGPTMTDFHVKRAAAAGRTLDPAVTQPHAGGPGIMRRHGRPEEIAYGILYLASDESSYVTGTCLSVDGGMNGIAQRN